MPISIEPLVVIAALAAAVLAWSAVWLLRAAMPRWGFVDVPNERSSHWRPTPRAGGLSFVVATPIVALAVSGWAGVSIPGSRAALLLGAALVASTGLLDDRFGLSVPVRFGAYSLAALVFVGSGIHLTQLEWPGLRPLSLGWLGIPLTLVWLIGLTNAYNFMDGIDGIAGTQAVVAAGAASLLALWHGEPALAILTASLGGGTLGFLPHNWPPARIFMGDTGSAFLGYCFAALAVLSGSVGGSPVPFGVWAILLAPFLFDTTLTLLARVTRGERWYEPHRQHLYQRLIRCGWSHWAVTGVYLCADLYLAILAISSIAFSLNWLLVVLLAVLPLAGIFSLVRQVEAGRGHSTASPASRAGGA